MSANYTTSQACKLLGIHPNTLRKYAEEGKIKYRRLPNGDRRFDLSGWIEDESTASVCYARVSQPKQKEDLQRQRELLLAMYPGSEIVSDIGSGLNFKRKGLRSILERVLRGEKLRVIVTYKDRLARFGFDLIEFLVANTGGEIVVLNKIESSPQYELVADLTAIVTVFSARLHGTRSHKNKKGLIKALITTEEDSKTVDGNL